RGRSSSGTTFASNSLKAATVKPKSARSHFLGWIGVEVFEVHPPILLPPLAYRYCSDHLVFTQENSPLALPVLRLAFCPTHHGYLTLMRTGTCRRGKPYGLEDLAGVYYRLGG